MSYIGTKPVDFNDVTEAQTFGVTGDLTVDTSTLKVDSANNRVGVGTTSPETPVEIRTTNKLGGTFTGTVDGEGLRVTQTDYTSGNFVSLLEAPFDDSQTAPNVRIGAMFDGSGANLAFGTSNSYGSGITSEAMRIDPSGNIGIGTTPASGVRLDMRSDATANIADFRNANSAGFGLYVAAGSGSSYYAFRAADKDNAALFTVDSDGNVLTGKTSTSVSVNGALVNGNGQYFSTTAGANTYHYYDSSNSRYNFYVLGNGGIANYSTNNVALSDQTEKKNIVTAASAWDDVKAFSLKEFHYNFEDDADPKRLGVIAQDIQVNHPSLVTSFKIDDETTKLGLAEQQLTWMAIKALQEAMAKIETLETKVVSLETQNADFETRLAALEAG